MTLNQILVPFALGHEEKYYDEEVSSHMLSWEIFMFIHNSCVPKELRIWLIYEHHEELGTYIQTYKRSYFHFYNYVCIFASILP